MSQTNFASRAVRALVLLHEQNMRAFLPVWREAERRAVPLPKTDNASYQSYGALLRHVLGAGRNLLAWVTESLGLPDPGVPEAPAPERMAGEAETYLESVLAAWRLSLAGVEQAKLRDRRHTWRAMEMYVEMMLEHAVVHPQRHALQLQELIRQHGG